MKVTITPEGTMTFDNVSAEDLSVIIQHQQSGKTGPVQTVQSNNPKPKAKKAEQLTFSDLPAETRGDLTATQAFTWELLVDLDTPGGVRIKAMVKAARAKGDRVNATAMSARLRRLESLGLAYRPSGTQRGYYRASTG